MENIIKTVLDKSDDSYATYLNILLQDDNKNLISQQESKILIYLLDVKKKSGSFPSESYLLAQFPEMTLSLKNAKVLSEGDLKTHFYLLLDKRQRQYMSREIMKMSNDVLSTGFTDKDYDVMHSLYLLSKDDTEENQITSSITDFKRLYDQRKNQPAGLLTFVKELDEKIGGLSQGTVNVVAGWTAAGKTIWALNMAYNNKVKLNYNQVYVSLEVPKEDIIFNLLCRHSYEAKFPEFNYISHEKQRRCLLTDDEEDYLENTVIPDYNSVGGKLVILDETDFKTFSFAEIRAKLEEVDDLLIQESGSGIDAVYWDHANLMKYSSNSDWRGKSEGWIINQYVSFIRKLGIKFRLDKDESKKQGKSVYRHLCNILLAQVNRDGWKKAVKKKGQYELTALSEANELERSAYRVFFVFSDDDLKEGKEAKVQLAKNRSGATLNDPISVFMDPEAYVFGEDPGGFGEVLSEDEFDSVFDDGGDNLGIF